MSRRGIRRIFRNPFRQDRTDEVDEEIAFHLSMKEERLRQEGLSPVEARRAARKRFGDVDRITQEMVTMQGRERRVEDRSHRVDQWRQDSAFALRQIRRAPGLSSVVVFTVALAIAATTAVFSVVDGVVLRPLPYPEPEELVTVWADYSRVDVELPDLLREWLSWPNLVDFRDQVPAVEALAAWSDFQPTLSGSDGAIQLDAGAVSTGMFSDVLQVAPLMGRSFFSPEEEEEEVAIISDGLWASAFGRDPEIVGKSIIVSGSPMTVVGVMGPGFVPPDFMGSDLWTLFQFDESRMPRGAASFRTIGRLADGATLELARNQGTALGARLEAEYPDVNEGVGYSVFPLRADMVRHSSAPIWVLFGAVCSLLIMACVNVTNLLLARGATRRAELAVRSSLGANRGRVLAQLMTETILLVGLGGLLGVGLSYLATDLLVGIAPAGTVRLHTVSVDGRILGFGVAITLLAGIACGVLPAYRGSQRSPAEALRSGNVAGSRRHLVKNTLVVSQVALALVLLVGAGLLGRSFTNLQAVDKGFDAENVLTFGMFLPSSDYPDAPTRIAFIDALESEIGSLPGVQSVGSVRPLPMTGRDGDSNFSIEGRPEPERSREQVVWTRRMTPGYLDAMGIEVTSGRAFDRADTDEQPQVVLINQTMADRFFDGDAVGNRINVNSAENPVWREIVGVVEDVKNFGVRSESRNAMYLPFHQVSTGAMTVTLRTTGDPLDLASTVRRTMADLDPQIAVAELEAMNTLVNRTLAQDQFVTRVLRGFAGVALLLAVLGLYGVIAYSVQTRRREMGVRIALGAQRLTIGSMVLRWVMALVGTGAVIGTIGAAYATKAIEDLLFGVSLSDPLTYGSVLAVLLLTAGLAGFLPARRATKVDPIEALNAE